MSLLRALFVFGTRPEAIKMAPVIREAASAKDIEPIVCLTGQHREMLDQVTSYFEIHADYDLQLMKPNQTLCGLTAECLRGIDRTITECTPDLVAVQGDTTTTMAGAMAAFYRQLPLAHIEAGLRTDNLFAPWPEEFNRRVTSIGTSLHLAPTTRAAEALRREGVPDSRIRITGNTVIDALLWTVHRERKNADHWRRKYAMIGDRRLVLITGHRRENHGAGLKNVCEAILLLARRFSDVEFLYPVHLNPNVREPVLAMLSGQPNVHLVAPVSYPEFVSLMDRSTLLLTDSGGIQEEALTLKKPVLVTRETTERQEAVESGGAEVVGTSAARIVERVSALLTNEEEYSRRQTNTNPYGDGFAAQRTIEAMLESEWRN